MKLTIFLTLTPILLLPYLLYSADICDTAVAVCLELCHRTYWYLTHGRFPLSLPLTVASYQTAPKDRHSR